MKKLMLAFIFLLASAAIVSAQDTTGVLDDDQTQYRTDQPADQDQTMDQDDFTDKEMISTTDLPQNIREQLQSQDYSGWTVRNVYRKMKDNETMYAVELSSGNQVKKVKFDAQGNVIKEKTKRDKTDKEPTY